MSWFIWGLFLIIVNSCMLGVNITERDLVGLSINTAGVLLALLIIFTHKEKYS